MVRLNETWTCRTGHLPATISFHSTMQVLSNRLGFMDLVADCKKTQVRFGTTTLRTPASSKCLSTLTHQVCLDSRHDICVDVSDSAGPLTFDRPRIKSEERALITTQPHCYISYIYISLCNFCWVICVFPVYMINCVSIFNIHYNRPTRQAILNE